jgi:uncharacterized protein (DUF58 family)
MTPPPTENPRRYLDPKVLSQVAGLELRARLVVEGFISGLHRSPYHGFSVEFAEHREYSPGDEIRHIDWHVYGKSDRYYVKRYEEETNLRCSILLDASASMGYSSGGMTKLEYASSIAAALIFMMLRQGDSVGLVTFDEKIREHVPPRGVSEHFQVLLGALEGTRPGAKTDIAAFGHEFAERVKRRGLIVVFSDLFDDPQRVRRSLGHFRHRKHEVIVFHVLDEAERTFPFEDMMLFKGMESGEEVLTDPRLLRSHYLAKLEEYLDSLKRGMRELRIDYVPLTTSTPFDRALVEYLGLREAVRGR